MCKMWKFISFAAIVATGCTSGQGTQPVAVAVPVQEESVQPAYVPQVNDVLTANPVAKVDHVAYRQVMLDGIQAEKVAVRDVRRSRTNDGYERIQVFVKNTTSTPVRLRYRFDWQDANGAVVMDPDRVGWEKMTLVPGDDGVFSSIAPKKDCADFRLRMKGIQQEERLEQ